MGITADTALRLARYFKMSPQFWLGLQVDYELDVAEDMLKSRLEKEIKPMSATGRKILLAAQNQIQSTGGISHRDFWKEMEKKVSVDRKKRISRVKAS